MRALDIGSLLPTAILQILINSTLSGNKPPLPIRFNSRREGTSRTSKRQAIRGRSIKWAGCWQTMDLQMIMRRLAWVPFTFEIAKRSIGRALGVMTSLAQIDIHRKR
jgi:hypothetical protein